MTSGKTRENNMQGDLNEERSLWTGAHSLDPGNDVQGGGSKRKRSDDDGKLPRKKMRPDITNSADAGPPAKESRSSVNNTNTSDSGGVRVETRKRKASSDDKVSKKKVKWSKDSSSSGSCVEMLSAESSDGMELSLSSENSGGGNFSSGMSSSINTRENNMHESCAIMSAAGSSDGIQLSDSSVNNGGHSSDSQKDEEMISVSSTTGDVDMLSVIEISNGKQASVSPDNVGGHFSGNFSSHSQEEERIFEMSSLVKTSRDEFEEKYLQCEPIGAGGFGSVYGGFRKGDSFPVAIKYIPFGDVIFEQVRCNGKDFNIILEVALMLIAAGLPGSAGTSAVVSLLDWYFFDGKLILVIERPVNSMDLLKYCQVRGGSLDEREAKMILRQLVDAAVHMHAKGVFHRDIKLENVLVTLESGGPRVRIIDFGCGSFSTDSAYCRGCGTLRYFPPEWFDQEKYWAQPTTVWQLGALFYSLLGGHRSFHTKDFIINGIQINSELSGDVKTLLHMCLIRDPMKRATLEMLQRHPALNYPSLPPTQGHL